MALIISPQIFVSGNKIIYHHHTHTDTILHLRLLYCLSAKTLPLHNCYIYYVHLLASDADVSDILSLAYPYGSISK